MSAWLKSNMNQITNQCFNVTAFYLLSWHRCFILLIGFWLIMGHSENCLPLLLDGFGHMVVWAFSSTTGNAVLNWYCGLQCCAFLLPISHRHMKTSRVWLHPTLTYTSSMIKAVDMCPIVSMKTTNTGMALAVSLYTCICSKILKDRMQLPLWWDRNMVTYAKISLMQWPLAPTPHPPPPSEV